MFEIWDERPAAWAAAQGSAMEGARVMTGRVLLGTAWAAAVLGAGMARAQSTTIAFEASLDYVDWSATVHANPGDTVYVRMRVRLDGAAALGLAGISCMPTLSRWNSLAGDSLQPFTPEPNLGVPFEPLNTGRLYPFASSHLPSGDIPSSVSGDTLVIGRAGTNVFGVSLSQLTPNLAGVVFNPSPVPNLFVYAVHVGDWGERWMVADAPPQYGANQRGSWYTQANGLNSLNANVQSIDTATIHVTPAPGGTALIVGVSWLAGRRRR